MELNFSHGALRLCVACHKVAYAQRKVFAHPLQQHRNEVFYDFGIKKS